MTPLPPPSRAVQEAIRLLVLVTFLAIAWTAVEAWMDAWNAAQDRRPRILRVPASRTPDRGPGR